MKDTIIFLHGGPGFKDYLKPFFEELQNEFQCHFYDQLSGADIQMHDLINQLHQFIATQKSKIILVGHSWGGVLAVEYVKTFPEKVSTLILMSTGLSKTHWYDEFHQHLKILNLEHSTLADIFLTAEEKILGQRFLEDCEKSFSQETFENLTKTYIKDYNLLPAFEKIQIPILNIFGENDHRFPRSVAESFIKINPNVLNVEIQGAGHFPFLLDKNNKLVLDKITSFLKNVK